MKKYTLEEAIKKSDQIVNKHAKILKKELLKSQKNNKLNLEINLN